LRSKDPLAIYLHEIKTLGKSQREEEYILARALEIAREVLKREICSPPNIPNEAAFLREALEVNDPYLLEILREWEEKKSSNESFLQPQDKEYQDKLEKIRQRCGEVSQVRSVLVLRNLHLVPGFARRYRKLGVPFQDLIQEGIASLLRAADKFDWRRGVRFSSYAQWWIQQAILKSLYSQSRTVRLPVYLNQKMKKIRDANRESQGETGTELTPEEISNVLKEPVNRIRRAMNADVTTISLDREFDSEEEYSLRNLLEETHSLEIDDFPEGPNLKERISDILQSLPEKERKILTLRYGLEGENRHTLEEVSKVYNVSRERIRQIQVQAIQKLLGPARKHSLASFLN